MLKFAKTLPVALQVYSVRDYASKDLEGTMMKLKEIGYDYVEPAGLYGKTAEEYKAVLDKCGITAICAHVPYAVPYLGDDDRPGAKNFETVLANIAAIGKKCAENGITLLYHNHDFEFIRMPDGRYGLDYMYDTVAPEYLQTELDCCWVNVGGEDPASYVRKYAGRCPVVHLKDFTGSKSANMYNLIGMKEVAETTNTFAFRPVGYGKQDIPTIITAAIESGAEYLVVEQDNPGEQTSLEAVTMSRNYLKTLGF